jgi:hypothetical protein
MKHRSVALLVYALALGPCAALFSAGTWAMPDNPDPANPATMSGVGIRAGASILESEQEVIPGDVPIQEEDLAFRMQRCRQDMASEARAGNAAPENPCVDSSETRQRFSVQLGRRLGNRGSILGEFDGVRADYRLGDGLNLNGIAGFPVAGAEDALNPERQVFGISAAMDRPDRTWYLSSYFVEQQENGQVSGRSAGGAIRRLEPGASLLFYADFDVAGGSPGMLMASGAWNLAPKTTVRATLDLHRRPIPGRQQKYLQQSMSVTEGWDWNVPTDRLAHYTDDGSREVGILNFGLSRILTQRIILSGDVVMLDATDGPDAAANPRSKEYFYHLKLDGKGLILPGARSKLDLRHAITGDGRTESAIFDTRYAVGRFWNLVSQLRADYHRPALESRSWWKASPNVKMEYQRSERSGFQIAAGGNLSNGGDSATDNGRASCYVSLAYTAKF